jgi:aldehyde:ferredoxin oxidoreductase
MVRGGYKGKILRVDLRKEKTWEERIPSEEILRKYIGGLGLGVKILSDELPDKAKPLDPENLLIFMTGPLTGTTVPCSSDWTVVTLNHNTGYTVGAGHSHGFFGAYLKFAGFDGIVVQGAAKRPVYMYIRDGQVEFRDASRIWGKDTHETEDLVKDEIGDSRVSVAGIGPAGENLHFGACIENDKHHTVAKAGVGAVMGSKNLKAVGVRGSQGVPIFNPKEFLSITLDWRKKLFEKTKLSGRVLTATHIQLLGKGGITRNYPGIADFIGGKNLTDVGFGRTYTNSVVQGAKEFKVAPVACHSCPIACCYRVAITSGPHKGKVATLGGGGENMEGAAGIIGVLDPGTIFWMTDLYDRMGFDTATPGLAIALAYECYEKGLLTKKDTGGLELRWGDSEAAVVLLDKLIKREGIGKILAEGPKKAAELIGGDAPKLAVHIKGTGYNLHDWRGKWSIMLGQVTAGAGPCWQSGQGPDYRPDPDLGYYDYLEPFKKEGVAQATRKVQLRAIWEDSIGICFFGGGRGIPKALEFGPRALGALTGWEDFTLEEAFQVAERVITLERLFNMKRGLTIENDLEISPRLLEPPDAGPAKGKTIAPYLRGLVKEYYGSMGWDRETGRPLDETIKKLGL